MRWFIPTLTLPFRALGALWPRNGFGCFAVIVLGLMILGALY